MIAFVQGEIADITEDTVVLSVNGFGINVHISGRWRQSCPVSEKK